MSDKFLNTGGSGNANLSNGTINAYLASLTIAGMKASMPIKTNSVNTLVSTKLDITDINSLESRLNAASQAGYELQLVSTDELNDIDYKTDYDKTTWSNTTLNTHNFYNYYATPHKPILRTPFVPLDRATNVFSEVDLDLAITELKDNIFIAGDFSITSSKFISHSCKISGNPDVKPTITAVNILTSLFNVSSDNVFFENLILENSNTSSNANCLYFGINDDAKNNAVHNCVLRTNEFAITSDHYQIQIYNNVFEFTGTADSHRYIYLLRCPGEVLIYENVFHSNGIFSTAFILINSPGGSSYYDGGHLVIYKNTSIGTVQRVAIMETEPINFKLSLLENTISTYTDFFILYGDTMLNGFTEITAYKNTVTLVLGSPGFKGLVGWDTPSGGGEITYSPIVRGSLNILPNNLRPDYSPLPNCTYDNPIVCFKNTRFTTSLEVPLNPPLVAFAVTEGITGPVSSVDNSIVFFDGTTGLKLKENSNFKFITGATYGDQLKVPDIETDDHFSLNEELTTMDTAISTNTSNNTGSVTVHSDVSNAGSGAIITAVERNNISSNVAKLVNQTAVQLPNPITTLVGELDVAKIKSYEHNCELEFNNTDAILTADGSITLTATTINLNGVSTTDQTTFTGDQQIVSKKYVDDANSAQNTAIGSNTTATQNITATAGVTNFTGTISSSNVKATDKIAIGTSTGTFQEADAIAIGTNTGLEQKCCAVAIGRFSGSITQQKDTIGIGNSAGYSNQQEGAVALGYLAGGYTQGLRSVAIGYNSGRNLQGNDSIAIGTNAGFTNQSANSIILNASGSNLNATTTGCYIKPMKNQTATNGVFYNNSTGELSYSTLDLSGISGSVTVHSDVSNAGSGIIISNAERGEIYLTSAKTQNINANIGVTEFTGKVSVDNPHENYITTINSVGGDPGIWGGGALQVGMLFTPTKNIKMTKIYVSERMFITFDNLPRVSIFGTDLIVPLIVFDVDETTKFQPALSGSYAYYTKDIQFEFQAGIQYSIQSDLYAGNGQDFNVKTYPAVLGTVLYGFWNGTPLYRKLSSPHVNTQIPFFFDCEDNDYTNHFSSNGNNLSKDIYGAGGILDRTTVRASNMIYNMKNTSNGFAYPDGIGYKSMFYNPSINEICYSSKEVVNDFYYTFGADAIDFHKDNMLIFSWTQSTGNLQVRTTGPLPIGMVSNSCLIGGTTVKYVGVVYYPMNIDIYPGNISIGDRMDTFISPDGVQPNMPSYHIITDHVRAAVTTIWIKRIQNNT